VRASVDLTNQRASFKGDVQVFPFDSVGNQLSAVNVEPTTVNVLITIGAVSTERTSAVQLVVKGRLPSGYQLSPVVFSPLTVTLSGSQDLINVPDLSRVLTAPVDITGLTGSKSFTVGIITPSGVTASPNSITVTISTTLIPTPPPTPTPRPTPTPTPG
jgi:YbbR domain-containing protein